ncbi:MAG TPA: hypothetical protein VGH22_15245 [Candidatus Binatia bacterium]|jgi:hypothetical protein
MMKFDREKLNFTSFKRQRCQVCRCDDKFNFTVSDKLWREIVPPDFQNKVVCLPCFDELARQKKKDYADSIEVLYFAGSQASFKFQTVQAKNIGEE